jgi:hypothetical protein
VGWLFVWCEKGKSRITPATTRGGGGGGGAKGMEQRPSKQPHAHTRSVQLRNNRDEGRKGKDRTFDSWSSISGLVALPCCDFALHTR